MPVEPADARDSEPSPERLSERSAGRPFEPADQPVSGPTPIPPSQRVQHVSTGEEPLTVVVATRDRPAMLESTLQALASACRPIDRVLVVDSASSDPAVRRVAVTAGVDVIRCDEPGTCRARNAGWQESATSIVAFTDDDCLPQPGWSAALAEAMGSADQPSFVTGRVIADGSPVGRGHLALSLHESTEIEVFGVGSDPSLVGHGANMAWRREALEQLGGFDEVLGPGAPLRAAEDHDLFWRSLSTGGTGRYEPGALVEHRQWRSRRQQLRAYRTYGVGSGALAVKRLRIVAAAGGPASPTPKPAPKPAPIPAPIPAPPFSVRALAGVAAKPLLWDDGLAPVGRSLRHHYEMGVLAELFKLTGSVEGALRARTWAIEQGHFTTPRS